MSVKAKQHMETTKTAMIMRTLAVTELEIPLVRSLNLAYSKFKLIYRNLPANGWFIDPP